MTTTTAAHGHIEERQGKTGTRFRAIFRQGGTRETHTFGSRAAAQEWLDRRHGQAAGLALASIAESAHLRFGNFYADNEAGILGGLSESSRKNYASVMKNHVLPRWWNIPLASITHADVTLWVDKELPKGRTASVVRVALAAFSKTMNKAVTLGYIATNPALQQTRPRASVKRHKIIDHAQVVTLANAIDPRVRAMVFVMAYGGLRYSEAAGLRPEDIAKDGSSITVVEQLDRHRSASKPATKQTKTAAGRRSVPLPPFVAAELRDHAGAYANKTWFFCTRNGTPIDSTNFRRWYWNGAVQALPERITPHDLRHTAAALWLRAGVQIRQVAVWLGHADPAFTLRTYGYLIPAQHDPGLDVIQAQFDKLMAGTA